MENASPRPTGPRWVLRASRYTRAHRAPPISSPRRMGPTTGMKYSLPWSTPSRFPRYRPFSGTPTISTPAVEGRVSSQSLRESKLQYTK